MTLHGFLPGVGDGRSGSVEDPPPLPKRVFVRMPQDVRTYYECVCPRSSRLLYGASYQIVVVVDEQGEVLVGYKTPHLEDTLKVCGYHEVCVSMLWPALKGAGTGRPAPAVRVEGRVFETYPVWFNETGDGPDWASWITLYEGYLLTRRPRLVA